MTFKKTISRFKLHHVLIWMIVFAVWFYLRYQDYSSTQLAIQITLLKVADLAVLVYLCNYVFIPKLLYKKRYAWFAAAFILSIVTSSLFKMQLIGKIIDNPYVFDLAVNWKQRIYDNIIPHFFLVIAGAAIKLLSDQVKLQKRLTEIAREKAEAELSFLKSQMNPHFLFNSLNSVYFLIDKNNTEARNALHQFSEMLRYQLYECNGEKIPVEKEIGYLKDYVDLQKLRLNKNCLVQFECSPDVKEFGIQPLLLIPFVENAFKHLSHYSAHHQNEVNINISSNNGHMAFTVSNTTEGRRNDVTNNSGGIGLYNVRKRLALCYPNKHQLDVLEKENTFTITLKLSVN